MSALAQQQEAFISALFEWPAVQTPQALTPFLAPGFYRGLQAYRTNGHVLAERALSVAYPVLAQMLGAESFADLARAHWHAQPPQRGDLAQWGDALADFVRHSAQLQDEPYLADVARLEWALHRCAFAADVPAQPATFALLTETDPQSVALLLAAGTAVVESAWPVTDILQAHRAAEPDFAQVGRNIRAGLAQTAVVWRNGFAPELRNAVPGEAALLVALNAGASLAAALDAASDLDFASWLPMAVQTGLVQGARTTS